MVDQTFQGDKGVSCRRGVAAPPSAGAELAAPRSEGEAAHTNAAISPLTQIFRSQYRQLVRFCRMRVKSTADAEDIVQGAFLAARRAYPDKGIEELRPLLFTLVRNAAVSFLKSGEHRRAAASVEIGEVADEVACARSPSPEQQVMDADNLVRAQEILDAMAPHRRDALLLHRIEGLTYGQIEERLSMSRTGVIMAIAEAVRELAEGLARAERRRTPPGR